MDEKLFRSIRLYKNTMAWMKLLLKNGTISDEEYAVMREIDDVLLYHEFLRFMGEKLWEPEPKMYSKPRFYFELFGSVEKDFTSACACLETACGEQGKENGEI